MKIILTLFYMFILIHSSFSQNLSIERKAKINQLIQQKYVKVTELSNNLLKLQYPNGKSIIKNIGEYKNDQKLSLTERSPKYDSTIIDLRTIDTMLYYRKYSFWQEIPISNLDFDYIRSGDVNNNGRYELYGGRKLFHSDYEPVTVYELNNANSFEPIYQYDSAYITQSIYDIDKDGSNDVFMVLPLDLIQAVISREYIQKLRIPHWLHG